MTDTTNPAPADSHAASFLGHAEPLTTLVESGGDWAAVSPCAGWTAADVLDHLIDTQRDFLTQRGVDLGARPAGVPAKRWGAHLAAVRRVLADPAVGGAEYDGHFGRTTIAASLAQFYGFDLLVHRWDLGRAFGEDVSWTDDELDAVEQALDGFGDNLYADGVCAPALPVDPDAPRQDRVLARTGRRA